MKWHEEGIRRIKVGSKILKQPKSAHEMEGRGKKKDKKWDQKS